jgi:hypothetical protein
MNNQIQILYGLERDISITRYFSLSKFLDLMENRTLFFASIATLKKQDRFEGVMSLSHRELEKFFDNFFSNRGIKKADDLIADSKSFASCWHLGNTENYAMWKIYGGRNDSIAISSNIGCLVDSIRQEECHFLNIVSHPVPWTQVCLMPPSGHPASSDGVPGDF